MPIQSMHMPLDLLTRFTLRPDSQSARPTARLACVCGTCHVARTLIKLRGVDLCAAETLRGVLGARNRVAAAVTEGHTGVAGNMRSVEVRPLGKGTREDCVSEAARVRPGGVGSRRRGRWSGWS